MRYVILTYVEDTCEMVVMHSTDSLIEAQAKFDEYNEDMPMHLWDGDDLIRDNG